MEERKSETFEFCEGIDQQNEDGYEAYEGKGFDPGRDVLDFLEFGDVTS